jgi:uncharacterized membrane protein YvlD (DUF360 family)
MLATAKSNDDVKRGENIIIGGLCIQIIFFGLFMAVALVFHLRLHKKPTQKSQELDAPWKRLLSALYVTSLFIMVRSVFRVAEYVTGKDGSLQSKEIWIYIFDALLMALVSIIFNTVHPSVVLVPKYSRSRIRSYESHLLHTRNAK